MWIRYNISPQWWKWQKESISDLSFMFTAWIVCPLWPKWKNISGIWQPDFVHGKTQEGDEFKEEEGCEGAIQACSLGTDWAYLWTYASSKSLDFSLCLFIYAHVNCWMIAVKFWYISKKRKGDGIAVMLLRIPTQFTIEGMLQLQNSLWQGILH